MTPVCTSNLRAVSLQLQRFGVFMITEHSSYSSFSNQITLIVHIQGVFNIPGRGFRQCITLTSSVPMMLNDVIVHVR